MNHLDDPVPAYLRIADDIAAAISDGRYAPGQRIPSETQMGAAYHASRGTIRRAVAELIRRGLVITVPQRGTYTNPDPGPHTP